MIGAPEPRTVAGHRMLVSPRSRSTGPDSSLAALQAAFGKRFPDPVELVRAYHEDSDYGIHRWSRSERVDQPATERSRKKIESRCKETDPPASDQMRRHGGFPVATSNRHPNSDSGLRCRRLSRLLVAVLAVATLATACGDTEDEPSAAETTSTPTTIAATDTVLLLGSAVGLIE